MEWNPAPKAIISAKDLRKDVIRSLRRQGYSVKRGLIQTPENASKDDYRSLNKLAVKKKMEKSGPRVQRYENKLLEYIANGWEIIPKNICSEIVFAQPDSEHELLFRYACLH